LRETGRRPHRPALLARLAGEGEQLVAVTLVNPVEHQELAQVGLLHADAVQLDAAQLGARPAKALGHFLAGEARMLTEPP